MTADQVNSDPHIHTLVLCANILVRKDGKFLLMRRSPLKKFAPNVVVPFGGKIDRDEDPLDAGIRELREETGLEVDNVHLDAVVTEIQQDPNMLSNWLVFYFSADYKSGDLIHTAEGESVLITAEEMKKEQLFPAFREILPSILNPNTNVVFGRFVYNKEHEIVEQHLTECQV